MAWHSMACSSIGLMPELIAVVSCWSDSNKLFDQRSVTSAQLLSEVSAGVLCRHRHLTHLGPFQAPGYVAERCMAHFSKALASRQPRHHL